MLRKITPAAPLLRLNNAFEPHDYAPNYAALGALERLDLRYIKVPIYFINTIGGI